VTGSTGSGKTRVALKIIGRLLDSIIESLIAEGRNPYGFGAFDGKGDLYNGTLFLIAERLLELQRTHPHAAALGKMKFSASTVLPAFHSSSAPNRSSVIGRMRTPDRGRHWPLPAQSRQPLLETRGRGGRESAM
jgi:hypothetical protein